MKTHNKLQFLKSKSFYVVLSVAVIAIAAVTFVGLKMSPEKSNNQNLVDLNTPIDVAENDETSIGEDLNAANTIDAASDGNNSTKDEYVVGDYTNDELLEFDVGSFVPEETTQVAEEETKENSEVVQSEESAVETTPENAEQVAENEVPEESVSVMQPNITVDSLSFHQESVITWPVKGNVILPFSVDNLVHYATLGEWKTNPAIMISSEAGTEVVSATKGIVSSIVDDAETGITVTMSVGNGYEIVYGQLTEVTCDIGEVIEEGTVIGKVAAPTKYYSVEGSNLYLQVLCEGTPVNPMLFLSGEE